MPAMRPIRQDPLMDFPPRKSSRYFFSWGLSVRVNTYRSTRSLVVCGLLGARWRSMFLLCREDGDGAGIAEDDAIPSVRAAHLLGLAGRDVGVGLLARGQLDHDGVAYLEPVQRHWLLLFRPSGVATRLVD